MNAARHLELQASLQRELDRLTVERGLSSTGRLVWLIEQIENYVARWLGLRAASAAPPSDDLFCMIEIGADLTSAEIQAVDSPAITESWREFRNVLAAVRVGSNTMDPQILAVSLAAVREKLPMT